jgi:hypothetical protein
LNGQVFGPEIISPHQHGIGIKGAELVAPGCNIFTTWQRLAAKIIKRNNGTVATFTYQRNVCFPGRNDQLFFINPFLNKNGYPLLRKVAHGIYRFLNGFIIAAAILRHG